MKPEGQESTGTTFKEASDLVLEQEATSPDGQDSSGKRTWYEQVSTSDGADQASESSTPLAPRKRAKTKDEKEQRRMERIMRNRQAAHASREKKRKHLEDLEVKCDRLSALTEELEEKLRNAQRSQVQTLEQHQSLRQRFDQLETAVRLARNSNDLSVLDSVEAEVAATPEYTPPLVADDCASPDALQLGHLPSLSNSASASPLPVDEDDNSLALPYSPLEAVGDTAHLDNSSSKTHHPAAMMSWLVV